MNVWYPAAWIFLGLIPFIILLHLLQRRRTRWIVPSDQFWTASRSRQSAHPGWRTISGFLSLILSLLILGLMIMALARPDVDGWFSGKPTLVVMDARLRMQAEDANGNRAFDKALAAAKSLSNRASARHPVGLVVFPDGPVIPFSQEPKPLREALSGLEPSESSGDLGMAVDQILITQGSSARIIVLTDRDMPGLDSPEVSVLAFGTAVQNVAITAWNARPSAESAGMTDIFLEVTNFADTDATRSILVSLDETLIDTRELLVPANASVECRFSFLTGDLRESQNGVLQVVLGASDALAADDRAQIAFPTGVVPRVLLVSGRDGFLEKAIAADSGIAYELLRPEAWQSRFAGAFPAVVFNHWVPPEFDSASWNSGSYFFVGTAPESMRAPTVDALTVTSVDAESPLLAGIQVDGLRASRVRPLIRPNAAGWQPVMEAEDFWLAMSYTNPTNPLMRSVVLAISPENSDFPQRAAFPLFVSNSLGWMLGNDPPITLTAGKEAPSKAGVYPADALAGQTHPVAVNPDSRAESDVRAASLAITKPTGDHQNPLFPQFWKLLLMAAVALLVLEWVAFHRRWLK